MRIVFLRDGETAGIGAHRGGEEREVADDIAAVLIKRGVAGAAGVFEGGAGGLSCGPGKGLDGINGSGNTGNRGEQANGRE